MRDLKVTGNLLKVVSSKNFKHLFQKINNFQERLIQSR